MSEDLPTPPKKPIPPTPPKRPVPPPTHPQAAMSSQNSVDAPNAKQKTNACNKPKTSTGATKVHGGEQVETRAGKGVENDTQLRYTATLSTIFTSFSGIATKEEYRSAFWHALLVGMLGFPLGFLTWFPFGDNELIATIIPILWGILYIILTWDDIKTNVKRFHAFGMSFTMYWIIPVLVVSILAYRAILTAEQTGRLDLYLFAIFMPVIIMVYGGILTIILFFRHALCDKGTSSWEACIAFMPKKRKVNKKLCVTCGIVILCGLLFFLIIFLCDYLSPTQRALRELRGRGVSDFSYRIIKENDVETIQLLIAAEADVNKAAKHGITPLYVASILGHTEIVEQLLAAGADVNKKNKAGNTPLIMASFQGHEKIVELLKAAGTRR